MSSWSPDGKSRIYQDKLNILNNAVRKLLQDSNLHLYEEGRDREE